jgi:NADPH:quinone reductase-like Zn-dependent oxidoreductase
VVRVQAAGVSQGDILLRVGLILFYSAWSLEKRQPRAYREDLASVLRLLADGAIEPIIAKTMPLERAAAAQRLLEEGSVAGKLVLVTYPEGSQR